MDGMGDNVAIFQLLALQFPDEHITHCVDTHVVSRNSTVLEDPEDPDRQLASISYVLECPHVRRFEVSVHVTAERPPE